MFRRLKAGVENYAAGAAAPAAPSILLSITVGTQ